MPAKGFLLTNPKDSAGDLVVSFPRSDGSLRTVRVRPGTQEVIETRETVQIRQTEAPPHFLLENGSLVPDKRRQVPGLKVTSS